MLISETQIKGLSETDLTDLRNALQEEVSRRLVVSQARSQQMDLAAQVREAVKSEPPLTELPASGVGPGQKILSDGQVYTNATDGWLAVGPGDYPGGYKLAPEA